MDWPKGWERERVSWNSREGVGEDESFEWSGWNSCCLYYLLNLLKLLPMKRSSAKKGKGRWTLSRRIVANPMGHSERSRVGGSSMVFNDMVIQYDPLQSFSIEPLLRFEPIRLSICLFHVINRLVRKGLREVIKNTFNNLYLLVQNNYTI